MNRSFNTPCKRAGTNSLKWDFTEKFLGASDVLPLWIADMDLMVSEPIMDALMKRVQHGIYGYTDRGSSYYEACSQWYATQHQTEYLPEWMSFAPTVVQALYFSIRALTQPGDAVIMQPPVYHPFTEAIERNGCTVVENPLLFHDNRYVMDLVGLEELLKKTGARIMILCSPHNPVGRVWTMKELNDLSELCHRYDVIVLSDEIHCDLVYPGHRHIPTIRAHEAMAQRTVTFVSASKTFNLAGLQVSTVIIPNRDIRSRYQAVLDENGVTRPNLFGMVATETAYTQGLPWLLDVKKHLEHNKNRFLDFLSSEIPEISCTGPEATYLLWLDCKALGLDDHGLRKFFLHDAKLGLDPGIKFGSGGQGFMRLNFACSTELLTQAMNNLHTAMTTHHPLRRKHRNAQ